MEKYLKFAGHTFLAGIPLLFLVILLSIPACVPKKMTVEEAKEVAVSMSEKSFVPPPRRIDDIMSILEQPGQFDPEAIAFHRTRADSQPPNTMNPGILARFYLQRGMSAHEVGRSKQALEDLRTALTYAERVNVKKIEPMLSTILGFLSQVEADFGNFNRAIAANKRALEIRPQAMSYHGLTSQYLGIGNLKAAEKIEEAGVRYCNALISNPSANAFSRIWTEIIKADMEASILEARGKYRAAESYRRYAVKLITDPGKVDITIRKVPRGLLRQRQKLAGNLAKQGRFVSAEVLVREALKESIALGGEESVTSGRILSQLGTIYVSQGRLKDAEAVTRAAIHINEKSGLSSDSSRMAFPKMLLGTILFAGLNFTEAMKQYDSAKQGMLENQFYYENRFARSPHMILCLIKTGRTEEAMASITKEYGKYHEYYGEKSYLAAQMLGLRGMANARMGNDRQALKDFSASIPVLIEKTRDESPYLRSLRLKLIVESYLDLLMKIHETKREKAFGINASAEMFVLCQVVSGSMVQSALGASGARAAAVDPELADLVRKEQDALNQKEALQTLLADVIAAPTDQQNPKAIKDLKAAIKSISQAKSVLLEEIKKRFPKYADFTDPQPVAFSSVQKSLRPGEALVVIVPSSLRTYVWAIPKGGDVHFEAASLNEEDLQQIVTYLRGSLDIDPGIFGDIPAFDLQQAYDLYRKILRPVENGWKDAEDLIVVAHGPMAYLPFSVLPIAAVTLGPEKGELFSNYRKVPWLIRKASITRQPSVSSFITLRKLPEGNPDRKAFAGFGDPIFNRVQLAMVEKTEDIRLVDSSRAGECICLRGIRITEKGNLDNKKILSCKLENLNRLPDTAEEIKSLAETMGADPGRDIFLGKSASEKTVKTMDLSNRRVIAFASHALIPGDLDGLDQPAIALSAPSVTGDGEDGLLTMDEIVKLILNADWVVLSACNTGAADGAGAEAVSGLGRAFFYAGTRALLVSMWPVETTSAKKLTTGLFKYQKENKTDSRVRALQKSMLALIDSPGLIDEATGKIVASYAHPLFWAPFIMVGDGR
jgi:CHAT domain-containing protein